MSNARADVATAGEAPVISNKRRWWITGGLLTGMFMSSLEATIVGAAMPTVTASLGGLSYFSWVFSAYLITSTVTVPIWGKLSDLYGRRRFYQIGIGLFLLGSFLSGLATSMTQLIIFRAIQGLGAGALIPLSMTISGDIYSLEERTRMQAIFSSVWVVSSVVGPLVGGFITDNLSWRWVFYINIPFGLAAAVIMGVALREARGSERPQIDYAGAAVLMLAVTTLMAVLMEGGNNPAWLVSPLGLALFVMTAALGVLFVWIERRAADPVIPFKLFRNQMVKVASVGNFLAGITMFGATSFIPLFAQGVLGDNATQAGSLLTPLLLSWVTCSVIGGRLLLRVGYRPTICIGLSLVTLGFLLLAHFPADAPRTTLYAELVLTGAGMGMTMLTLLLAMQSWVPRSQLGVATSINQFARSIGGAFGVAIMGVVLTVSLSSGLERTARTTGAVTHEQAVALAANPNALIKSSSQGSLPPAAMQALRDAMTDATHNVFWVVVAAAALGCLVCTQLPAGLRNEEADRELFSAENAEQLLMAEMTTIDAEHEPLPVPATSLQGEGD